MLIVFKSSPTSFFPTVLVDCWTNLKIVFLYLLFPNANYQIAVVQNESAPNSKNNARPSSCPVRLFSSRPCAQGMGSPVLTRDEVLSPLRVPLVFSDTCSADD